MKKISYKILLMSVLLLAGYSCTENMEYNPGNIVPVNALYFPSDSYYSELLSGSSNKIRFSWAPTSAEDGTKPMYEVVFYKDATGTEEISRISAGSASTLYVSHKDMNKVMNLTGVLPEQSGVVYWSVVASRAEVEANHPTPRKMTIKRLKGFKIAPEKLYITGAATEGGAEIGNAMVMRTLGDGEEFEIFTKLKAGEYNITDGKTADARRFNIDDNGIIQEAVPTANSNAKEGIYRIKIDLSSCSVSIDLVENVRFVMCIQKNDKRPLIYEGNGVWKGEGFIANFDAGWQDDRYFFRADIGGVNTKIGAKNLDNQAPANASTYKFDVFMQGEGNPDWDYSFKVIPQYRGSKVLKINTSLYLSADLQNYYHVIEYPDMK